MKVAKRGLHQRPSDLFNAAAALSGLLTTHPLMTLAMHPRDDLGMQANREGLGDYAGMHKNEKF